MRAHLLVLVLLVACAPPAPDAEEPRPAWVGEHFTIDTTVETEQLCAGSVQSLDRFIERAFAFLGEPVPDDFVALVEVGDISVCSPAAHACYLADPNTSYLESLADFDLPLATLRHELVHAITWEAWGPSVSFFAEGIAAALEGPVLVSAPIPVGDQLTLTTGTLDYGAAALFTRFLIDTRGLDAFRRMYQGARSWSEDDIRALFLEVYGESLAELEAEYLASPLGCTYAVDLCEAEGAERVADVWSHSFVVSCDDPGYVGVRDPSPQVLFTGMWTSMPLRVERAGRYRLRSSGKVELWGCGACVSPPDGLPSLDTDVELDLDAGLYTLLAPASSTSRAVQDVELRLVDPAP
ncbi:hypothetical protein [Nannocystis punicea]|uniref:Peptidase MA superfamily protein n=1 Tax=Nannocystis punicea TaxID=2995304 RepID=A0ABY7H801_9BACT|nr:hypothetical protein [Nannocystis poenicansa]WAS95393.1 hypothetical protein O0S08_04470 [Nannocystis poenicansa]